jgi:sigma-B regulation protein RsbU (phosphoserine phosphatase)
MLDASGHGVSAALRAASIASLFRADNLPQQVAQQDPGDILTTLNRRNPITPEGHYFTIWVGCADLRSGELRFSTAGHAGALLIRRGNEVESLSRPSLPLGFLPDTRYSTSSVTLATGDRLLLFSDGLYEGASPQGERWGLARLRRAVVEGRAHPLDESLNELVRLARAWQQRDSFDDDAALLAMEVTSPCS